MDRLAAALQKLADNDKLVDVLESAAKQAPLTSDTKSSSSQSMLFRLSSDYSYF